MVLEPMVLEPSRYGRMVVVVVVEIALYQCWLLVDLVWQSGQNALTLEPPLPHQQWRLQRLIPKSFVVRVAEVFEKVAEVFENVVEVFEKVEAS
jgi:hypothetical protein